MGCSKRSSKREVRSNPNLPQETRNISNKQPNLTLKAIRERKTTTTKKNKVSRRNHKEKMRNEGKRNEGNDSKDQ